VPPNRWRTLISLSACALSACAPSVAAVLIVKSDDPGRDIRTLALRVRGGPRRRGRRFVPVAMAVAAVLAASCSTSGPSSRSAARGSSPQAAIRSGPARSRVSTTTFPPTTTAPPTTTTTFTPEEPGWNTLSTGPRGIAIDERTQIQTDGTQVTVVRFLQGHVDYSLHVGSQDPPTGQAVIGPDSGAAIGASERPLLLACFNGGFKASAGAGGFEVGGQILTPLSVGLASLVIDTAGLGYVGVWGQDVPPTGISVFSVRQNLPPLVEAGQPSSQIDVISAWGATLGGGAFVARSALAEDASGDLLYAASMSTVPADLAFALISAGAVRAMELDINPEWVQMDTASTPGAPLAPQIPGQNRPADQCESGWTRDFVAVLSIG
jgi:hypothetical protein